MFENTHTHTHSRRHFVALLNSMKTVKVPVKHYICFRLKYFSQLRDNDLQKFVKII